PAAPRHHGAEPDIGSKPGGWSCGVGRLSAAARGKGRAVPLGRRGGQGPTRGRVRAEGSGGGW
ncbi:unnamed protein product, partial [Polarella glacialis]